MSELINQIVFQGGVKTEPGLISTYNENHLMLEIADTTYKYEINTCTISVTSTKSTILGVLEVVSTTNTTWSHPISIPVCVQSDISLPISSTSNVNGIVELIVLDSNDYAPTIPVSVITTPGTAENQPFWS